MTMRLYLAGPMTGFPQFNFPAFDQWAERLRAVEYDVLSPHEADPPEVQAIARASATGDPAEIPPSDGPLATALRNVNGVFNCDGIALMDDWYKSAGVLHEIATAHRFRIPVAPAVMWEALGASTANGLFKGSQ